MAAQAGTRQSRAHRHGGPASDRRALPLGWIVAFLLAATLHAGGVGYVAWQAKAVDDSDALGAPAIEIGVDLAAPREDQDDLPPGPPSEDSAASVAAAEQHQKVVEEAPKEQPKESDDPDRVVAPEVVKETKEETPKVVESQATQSSDSVASEAAAPPTIETAKESPQSTAPSPGTGASADLVRMAWQRKLVAHINRYKRYPANASRKTVQLIVAFTLDRLGHVVAAKIETGSGDAAFDQAALTMVRKADPVPPPPPLLADAGLSFSMPVNFQSKQK